MPEPAEALVRRMLDRFNAHDIPAIQALCTPDVEIALLRSNLDGATHSGPDAIAGAFAELDETWETIQARPEEFRTSGDHVIALCRLTGRGRTSGATVDLLAYMVYRLRDGAIAVMQTHSDESGALAALGLDELPPATA